MNQEKIGKFIADLRKKNDLTQEELANKLGITKNAVSKWERGISLMDMSLLNPLCDILGITIAELLSGEKIKKDDYQLKTDDVIKKTIDYTNKRIKKSKIRSIILTLFSIIILACIVLFAYKLYLVNKYTFKSDRSVEDVVSGLNNQREIKIYKRTIEDDKYLVLGNFKIRNDFQDYTNESISNIYQIQKNGKIYIIDFIPTESNIQLIDTFTSDIEVYGKNLNNMKDKFNSADRKFFLLKNDINNDVDFYKYVADNYYKNNNIFMNKRSLMENYSFNAFVSIAIPKIEEITFIKGDYEGVIFKSVENNNIIIHVQIIRDGKIYGFSTNDDRFDDENYLIDLLGTIEIR